MSAYQLIAIGIILGMLLTLAALAALSKKGDPDPESRELGRDRRKRNSTRLAAQRIAEQCNSGALTLPQGAYRLREIEAPASALNKCVQAIR